MDAVVVETGLALGIPMTPQNPEIIRDPDNAFHRRKRFNIFGVQGLGVPDEVDLGQGLLIAEDIVDAYLDVAELVEEVHGFAVGIAFAIRIRVEYQKHGPSVSFCGVQAALIQSPRFRSS